MESRLLDNQLCNEIYGTINLLQVEHAGSNVVGPRVVTSGTVALDLPVAVHDRLQD